MDGRKDDPGGPPASAASLLKLASEPEAISWAEIDPTKVLGRRRGRWFFVWSATVSCGTYLQQKSAVHGVGGRGG